MNISPIDRVVMELSQVLEVDGVRQTESFVTERVKRVSEFLRGDPALFEEPKVIECIEKFRKSNIDPKIKKMITGLMFNSSAFKKRKMTSESEMASSMQHISKIGSRFDEKTGILTISEKTLNEISDEDAHTHEFWNFISRSGAQGLVIEFNNKGPIIYEKFLLNQLLEKRPNIKDLTEMWTLQFDSGVERLEPKAKLQLCGTFFDIMEFSENKTLLQRVSYDAFETVLHEVETGTFNPPSDQDGYDIAVDFLDFHSIGILPESVIGQEKLNKYLGDVGEVPRPSREFLKALDETCPFSNDVNIKTKDSHVVTWVPKRVGKDKLSPNRLVAITNSDKSGANKIGFDRDFTYLPEGIADQEAEGGYWLLMLREPPVATRGMTYENAEKYIQDNYEDYQIPLTIDAMLCVLLNYICSGEKRERILARENPLRYTWCKENGRSAYGAWHMVVGALASSGLCVNRHDGARALVGVCPLRKFLGP
jgi:hypothetical protein